MKVVFDTDPGIDDAMALLYLNACPSVELLGITSIFGNASLERCTDNALILAELYKIKSPVYRGSPTTIKNTEPKDFPDFVHGVDGLGDVTRQVSSRTVEVMGAVDFLIETAQQNDQQVTIIAVGHLTNIAFAIQKDTNFAKRIKNIVFMGGSIEHPGNVSDWAEANIYGDPEAAQIVFDSGIPLTMVGLDVTMKTCMSLTALQNICDNVKDLGEFLLAINQVYADYYKRSEKLEAFPVHDSSAVACAIAPELFTMRRGMLACLLHGEQRGRTKFTEDAQGKHQICTAVEAEKLLNHYHDIVTSHY